MLVIRLIFRALEGYGQQQSPLSRNRFGSRRLGLPPGYGHSRPRQSTLIQMKAEIEFFAMTVAARTSVWTSPIAISPR